MQVRRGNQITAQVIMTFLKHSLVYQLYRKIHWFLLEKEYEGTIELMIFPEEITPRGGPQVSPF